MASAYRHRAARIEAPVVAVEDPIVVESADEGTEVFVSEVEEVVIKEPTPAEPAGLTLGVLYPGQMFSHNGQDYRVAFVNDIPTAILLEWNPLGKERVEKYRVNLPADTEVELIPE